MDGRQTVIEENGLKITVGKRKCVWSFKTRIWPGKPEITFESPRRELAIAAAKDALEITAKPHGDQFRRIPSDAARGHYRMQGLDSIFNTDDLAFKFNGGNYTLIAAGTQDKLAFAATSPRNSMVEDLIVGAIEHGKLTANTTKEELQNELDNA